MDDLISRKALLEEIKENHWGWFSKEMMLCILEAQPTVEAVPVVRCKDCVSYNPRNNTCSSMYLSGQTLVNGYCFNGSKKKV